ncbi:adenylate/guanylate cyclase domain-containing protein [Amycolatopsis sp. NPDC049253]|uniref:adenylate/guanylate cyclase domain-containing protein n=1 Tax=Amycolatopsis sp. NPDC049253 TaxID=3155274 RepID=UPI003412ED50
MPCSACAAALPEDARFCPACGTRRPEPAALDRRKVVTALFCDLVGSTELSGALEAESLRAVMMRYFERTRERITAHGGTVEKFIGDAVMAVFGVPVVREDDALRAATAALELLAALEELNEELETAYGCRLAARIGLNTGEVVASADRGGGENLVSGEVVNVAARLQQHAGPGQVLVGPTTYELLGPAARVEFAGRLSLKGKTEPVAAYRLFALTGPTRTHRGAFVGRVAELARLTDAWLTVQEGRGRVVAVRGDAGIGKTRLLKHWLDGLPGVALGATRCDPYRDEASLMPLARALRPLLPEPPALLRTGLLADGTPSPSPDATYAAVTAALTHLARTRPVLLLIDDLHWAAPALPDGLARLAAALREERVLFVCSGRPPYTNLPGALELTLPPLSTEDSHLLAAGFAEVQAHDATLLQRAVGRAEGNPLHLEHLLAVLGRGTDPDRLPAGITAVLAARLDTLARPERTTLEAASVVGRQFGLRQVRTLVTEASFAELDGLVEPAPPGRHRFASGLLHEVTYQGISKLRRAEWHELLAATSASAHHLEQAYRHRHDLGLRDEHSEALRAAAARALAEAGRAAAARADLSWAEDLYRRALSCSTVDDSWWTSVALGLGETCLALGEADEGRRLLQAVLASADPLAVAHAELQLSSLDSAAGRDAADVARATLPVFTAHGDRLGLARAHVRLAQEEQLHGRHSAALALLDTALEHADEASETALALGAVGMSLWHGPVPADEATRRCHELLAKHRHETAVVTLTYPLANLYALRGRFAEAREQLAVADEAVRRLGHAEAAAIAPLFTAGVEALAGNFGVAETLLRAAVATGMLPSATRELARVLLCQGKPAGLGPAGDLPPGEAADHLGLLGWATGDVEVARHAVAEAARTDSPVTLGTAYLDLARTLRVAGRPAGEAAERAAEWFRRKGHVVGRAWAEEYR